MGSCVAAFLASTVYHKGNMAIMDVQNATLAGGVAIGAVADGGVEIWGALLIGLCTGWLSTTGFNFIYPRFKFFDTCGVLNLHLMPGLLGALISVFTVFIKDYSTYQINSLYLDVLNGRTIEKQCGV